MTTATRPAIDRFVPRSDAHTRQRCFVAATPEDTYAAIWDADLLQSRLARVLSAVASRTRSPRAARLGDMLGGASPWILLDDEPGAGVVLGLLWTPPAGATKCAGEEFAGFAAPGFAKVAWAISIHPFGASHSLLETETRTAATDSVTRRRLRVIWPFMAPFAALLRRLVMQAIAAHAVKP